MLLSASTASVDSWEVIIKFPIHWCNHFWTSLEEGAGKRGWGSGKKICKLTWELTSGLDCHIAVWLLPGPVPSCHCCLSSHFRSRLKQKETAMNYQEHMQALPVCRNSWIKPVSWPGDQSARAPVSQPVKSVIQNGSQSERQKPEQMLDRTSVSQPEWP